MTEHERRLIEFALDTLEILEGSLEWGADTLGDIAAAMHRLRQR